MIRLRCQIERGLRHPLVGPLLLVVLAVLVVFTAFHETTESFIGDAALACVAIALVLLAALPLVLAQPGATGVAPAAPSRAPPFQYRPRRLPSIHVLDFPPLRL